MYDMNLVVLSGRLTRDPELKYLESGYAICNFSLAVNRGKKKDSEEELPAYFFNCFAWGKTGENISKYFTKGRKILITGELEHQRWTNESGENKSAVKVNVRSFQFMDSKKNDDPAKSASGKSHDELQAEADYFREKREEIEKKIPSEGTKTDYDLGDDSLSDEIPF